MSSPSGAVSRSAASPKRSTRARVTAPRRFAPQLGHAVPADVAGGRPAGGTARRRPARSPTGRPGPRPSPPGCRSGTPGRRRSPGPAAGSPGRTPPRRSTHRGTRARCGGAWGRPRGRARSPAGVGRRRRANRPAGRGRRGRASPATRPDGRLQSIGIGVRCAIRPAAIDRVSPSPSQEVRTPARRPSWPTAANPATTPAVNALGPAGQGGHRRQRDPQLGGHAGVVGPVLLPQPPQPVGQLRASRCRSRFVGGRPGGPAWRLPALGRPGRPTPAGPGRPGPA